MWVFSQLVDNIYLFLDWHFDCIADYLREILHLILIDSLLDTLTFADILFIVTFLPYQSWQSRLATHKCYRKLGLTEVSLTQPW